jgi:hypothetical protein
MNNNMPKLLIILGIATFFVGSMSFMVGESIISRANAQASQILKGKKCKTTRDASKENSMCQNGACPSSVKHYAQIGECIGTKSCYQTCEYERFEYNYEVYRVDEV